MSVSNQVAATLYTVTRSNDVCAICDAVALFRRQHKSGDFATLTSTRRWTQAWKDVIVDSGPDPAVSDAAKAAKRLSPMYPAVNSLRQRGASSKHLARLVPTRSTCLRLASLSCFLAMTGSIKASMLIIACKRGTPRNDAEGYASVCIDVASTLLGKRLCFHPWYIEPVPDREDEDGTVNDDRKRSRTNVVSVDIDEIVRCLARQLLA